MSIHFVPQWVKPIKPSGTTPSTSSSDIPAPAARTTANNPASSAFASQPFPALSNSTNPPRPSPNSALSYSRITNNASSPQSPGFPTDNSYFPANVDDGNPKPFRYSREQILALWDENKVKTVPIELSEMMENGAVLVSRDLIRPVGLRDLNDIEKKLLATSVHPPTVNRRQNPGGDKGEKREKEDKEGGANGLARRVTRDSGKEGPAQPNGRTAFGGFGRGEGGAFGGGKFGSIGSAPVGDQPRAPGSIGSGFGSKRIGRKTESIDAGPEPTRGGAPWRNSRTTSGNFEGVLGFGQGSGNAAPSTSSETSQSAQPLSAIGGGWREGSLREKPEEKEPPNFGSGGGPGWGSGQRKWRMAAIEQEKIPESTSAPTLAEASNNNIEQESENYQPSDPAIAHQQSQAPDPAEEKVDLGAMDWLYRDPNGQEQGPFTGTQMQDWYSHGYFQDDLPVKRIHESSFNTLAALKLETNAVQPFLTPPRPRAPPGFQTPPRHLTPQHQMSGIPLDAMRDLHMNPNQFQQPIERRPFYSAQFGSFSQQQSQPFPQTSMFPPSGGPWNDIAPPQPDHRAPFGGFPGEMHRQVSNGATPIGQPMFGAPDAWSHRPDQHQQPQLPHLAGGFGPFPGMQHPHPHQDLQSLAAQSFANPAFEQQNNPNHQTEDRQSIQADNTEFEELIQGHVESAIATPSPVEESLPVEPEVVKEEVKVEETAPSAIAPPSVWGTIPVALPPSKEESSPAVTIPVPAPSITNKLPPAPASLPPKPVTARKASASETTLPTRPTPPAATPEKATVASAKTAPWERPSFNNGPSLRDIQEAEAKVAEAKKKQTPSEVKASSGPLTPSAEETVTTMSWGLPSSASGKPSTASSNVASPAVASPAVWGGGDAGPKKTLKEIQEEEERRKKAVQAKAAATAAQASSPNGVPGTTTKRGYADLAAATSSSAIPPGWSTVGTGGKVVPGSVSKASSTPTSVMASLKPQTLLPKAAPIVQSITPVKKSTTNGTIDESTTPSLEFLKWTKVALTGLKTPIDEFITMLLSFPIDPPAALRAENLEIISDSVYANSSTLDGRRFAQEFYEKRKADAKKGGAGVNPSGGAGGVSGIGGNGKNSLADVVKSVPIIKEDLGFKIVKAKGKKK